MNETRQATNQTLGIQAHWLEAQVYRALANPTRLDILYTLGDGPRTVTVSTHAGDSGLCGGARVYVDPSERVIVEGDEVR